MSSGVDIAYNDCTHGAASHEQVAQVAQIHVFGGANTLGVWSGGTESVSAEFSTTLI